MKNFEGAALLPLSFHDMAERTVHSIEDLVALGSPTLRAMIDSWNYWIKAREEGVAYDREKWAALLKASAADIRREAAKYRNPSFSNNDLMIYDTRGDAHTLEPTPEVTETFSSGDTTLNMCGFCHFADGGSSRYNYSIEARCGIKDDRRYLPFITRCFVGTASDDELENIPRYLNAKLTMFEAELASNKQKVATLRRLARIAKKKPALPRCRSMEWFKLGEEMVCYVTPGKGSTNGRFIPARITNLLRDGNVIELTYHSAVGGRTKGNWGSMRPEILHVWEFDYLVRNPDFAETWVTEAMHDDDEAEARNAFWRAIYGVNE